MRCPACNVENAAGASQCSACGEELKRKPRRRGLASESQTPFSTQSDTRHPLALMAYRCAVFGLIPFLGLLLGPAALVLGILAWRRVKGNPTQGSGAARAAMVLGSLVMLTNWTGLAFMLIGLAS